VGGDRSREHQAFRLHAVFTQAGLGGIAFAGSLLLSWKAAEHGIWTRFIELAGEINTQMPRFVISAWPKRSIRTARR